MVLALADVLEEAADAAGVKLDVRCNNVFDRDTRILEIVDTVTRLPEERRQGYLAEACAGDATLADEVMRRIQSPRPFHAGQVVGGRFLIVRELAEGGMGVVYEVMDEKLRERRALKCAKFGYGSHLPPEARHALRVTHPNVCRVFEIHSAQTPEGPVDFLTMELIQGGTLASRLKEQGPFKESEAREIALQICAGVAAAHQQNLLHRDLKASNVLLTKDARGGIRAVVTDFGLAQEPRAPDSGPAMSGIAGTPAYLAPERWKGEPATVVTDIYALGVVLHELISGKFPDKRPAAEIPPLWRKVIRRCMEPDPQRRYASVAEVAESLSGRARRRRRQWIFAATALLLVVLAAVLWRRLTPVTPPARLAVMPLVTGETDPRTVALVQGASYDLSGRLVRLSPRPPQLVVIPVEDARALAGAGAQQARERLGATHLLQGTVTRRGSRLRVRGAIIDASTQVAVREISNEYDDTDAGGIVSGLAAMVGAVFHLPKQTPTETVNAAAYRDYAEGMALLKGDTAGYSRAAAAFEKAIALDPKSALPHARLAEACYRGWIATRDPQWVARGREQLAQAERLNPDSLAVRLAAGSLSLVPGSYERAAREFQRAIQLDAASVEAWHGLAQAYEGMQDRSSDAAAAYLKAIEIQPGYYRPLMDFGAFYRRIGNYAEAEKQWRRVTELAPRSMGGHVNLGGLYSDMGRYADAERELRLALEIDPHSRAVLNNLGALYQYMGRDAEAVKYFVRTDVSGPQSYILMLNLGDSYRRTGRPKEAAEAYSRGRKLAELTLLGNPRDAAVRSYIGYFALRLGDRAAAERELVQALNFGQENKIVLRRAVICYEAMGQRDRALAILQSAPADLIRELSRQPDLAQLRQDPRFAALVPKTNP